MALGVHGVLVNMCMSGRLRRGARHLTHPVDPLSWKATYEAEVDGRRGC
jgi:hypothetical protein